MSLRRCVLLTRGNRGVLKRNRDRVCYLLEGVHWYQLPATKADQQERIVTTPPDNQTESLVKIATFNSRV